MNTRKKVVLLALGLGLACGIIIGIAVYLGIGDRYTASSVLRVSMQADTLLPNYGVPLIDRDRFEIFKNTQQESLLGRMVLMSALRNPAVRDIPIVREKTQYGDPVDWLTGKLSVSFPGNAEIMMVSLSLADPKEAKTLVNAVVDSYINEVVSAENERKKRKYDDVDKICAEKEQLIRRKREELQGLDGGDGLESPDSLSTRQKLVLEELAVYRSEKARNDFEIAKLKGELAGKRALLDEIDTAAADPGELETLVDNDPRARELSAKLANAQAEQQYHKTVAKTGATIPSEQAKTLQAQYDARIKELSHRVRDKQRTAVMRKMIELVPQLKNMQEAQAVSAQKIAKLAAQAERSGGSVDIQMIQGQLRNLDTALARFVTERERLNVEIKSAPRILVLEPAEEPPAPTNLILRLALAAVAALLTFCCVVAVVILSYALTRRSKTAAG